MEIFILIAVIFIGFILISGSKKTSTVNDKKETLSNEDLPYKKKLILTKNEYLFYNVLKKITDQKGLLICPKVGLKDLFDVTDKKNYMKYFGRIAQKHIDFLICDSKLRPLFAIELDDATHKQKNRIESDDFKNKLFERCDLKLKRIKALDSYSEEYILQNLFSEMNTSIEAAEPHEDNQCVHKNENTESN